MQNGCLAHPTVFALPTTRLTCVAPDVTFPQGTLIRVFALPSGDRLHQFRRGSYPVTIHSLAFSPDSTLLVVSSETDTIHVFRMEDPATAAAT